MGVYLSQPITDKESKDYESGWLKCGVSSMQGWRATQEDAHNCCLDFEKEIAFFGVYDGHGGHEVAEYTSKYLPEFLKTVESYKKCDYEQALIDAYLEFDATLKQSSVVAELKSIACSRSDVDSQDKDDDEGENVQELKEEAKIPLDELIARYACGGSIKTPGIRRVSGESSSSPASPYLKAKASQSKEDKPGTSKEVKKKDAAAVNGVSDVNGESDKDNADESAEDGHKEKSNEDGDSEKAKTVNGEIAKEEELEKDDEKDNTENVSDSKDSGDQQANQIMEDVKKKVKDEEEELEHKIKSAIRIAKRKATVSMLAQLFEDPSESDSDDDESFQATDTVSAMDDDDEEEEAEEEDEGETATADGDDEEADDEEDEEDSEDDEDSSINLEEETAGSDSGCTAVVALLVNKKLYVANAGDSRAVLATKDGKALDLSIDHKPDDKDELARITAAGGKVTSDGRVNGGLNLSRALGDHSYKKCDKVDAKSQMITALPDIQIKEIEPEVDEFLVLACDGIWNSMSSQEVVDFVRPFIKEGVNLSTICEKLFERCLAPDTLGDGTGCDNMTCIIVQFKPQNDTNAYVENSGKRAASPSTENEPNKRTKVDESLEN